MRSRRYDIPLNRVKKTHRVTVYADRSVEIATMHHDHNDEVTRRPNHYQTREEAAWILSFARFTGYTITRTFI